MISGMEIKMLKLIKAMLGYDVMGAKEISKKNTFRNMH
jgi:hypothetical protein